MKRRVRIARMPNLKSGAEVKLQGLRAGLGFNANVMPWPIMAGEMSEPDLKERSTLGPVPREEANLEAEKDEVAMVPDNTFSGVPSTYVIGGKRHYENGTPLNLPDDSFIFSDTAKMRIKDPAIYGQFGMPFKKSGYTPAEIAKKYNINPYKKILLDPNADKIQKETAERMIANYNLKLGKLALIQESMKGFPQGIPAIAMPYVNSMGIDPAMLFQNPFKQQDDESAEEDMGKYGIIMDNLHKQKFGGPLEKYQNKGAKQAPPKVAPKAPGLIPGFGSRFGDPNRTPTKEEIEENLRAAREFQQISPQHQQAYDAYIRAIQSGDKSRMIKLAQDFDRTDLSGFGNYAWNPFSSQNKLSDLAAILREKAQVSAAQQQTKNVTLESRNLLQKRARDLEKYYSDKLTKLSENDPNYYSAYLDYSTYRDLANKKWKDKGMQAAIISTANNFVTQGQAPGIYIPYDPDKDYGIYDSYSENEKSSIDSKYNDIFVKKAKKDKKETPLDQQGKSTSQLTNMQKIAEQRIDSAITAAKGPTGSTGSTGVTGATGLSGQKVTTPVPITPNINYQAVRKRAVFDAQGNVIGEEVIPQESFKSGTTYKRKYGGALEKYDDKGEVKNKKIVDYIFDKTGERLIPVYEDKTYGKPIEQEGAVPRDVYDRLTKMYYEAKAEYEAGVKYDPAFESPKTLAFQKEFHKYYPEYSRRVVMSDRFKTRKAAQNNLPIWDISGNEDYYFGPRTEQYFAHLQEVNKEKPAETKPEGKKQEVKKDIEYIDPGLYAEHMPYAQPGYGYTPMFPQDSLRMLDLASKFSNIRASYPWMPKPPFVLADTTFLDPTREYAQTAEQAAIATQGAAQFASPQQYAAAATAFQGKAAENIANIGQRYENANVAIANDRNVRNADIMNKMNEIYSKIDSERYRDTIIARDLTAAERQKAKSDLIYAYSDAKTNQAAASALNAVNQQYYIDTANWGTVGFRNPRGLKASSRPEAKLLTNYDLLSHKFPTIADEDPYKLLQIAKTMTYGSSGKSQNPYESSDEFDFDAYQNLMENQRRGISTQFNQGS